MRSPTRRRRASALATVLSIAIGLLCAAAAQAQDLSVLDAQATSPGRVIEDSAGNAYVAWTHGSGGVLPDTPTFCKIPPGGTCTAPLALPIPGATIAAEEVAGLFPVFGPGNTVYVVGPRFVKDDVVIWTSTDGGASFNAGTINAGGYSSKSDPASVLLSGSNLLIGADNSGLGFSSTPAAGGSGTNLDFADPGEGEVVSSSLGLDAAGHPVEAFWDLSSVPYQVLFYRYKGAGSLSSESSWEGPLRIGDGYEVKLAGGASGLFSVSEDYGGGAEPSLIDVRKYNGSGFGAPVTLAADASTDLFLGGAIAQSPGGRVAVAWPGVRPADQATVMRLFTSTDGGASFGAETDVAQLGASYAVDDNAQLALGDNGQGWVTYSDAAGLHLADLNPIAAPNPQPAKPPVFRGKTRTITKAVGGNLLTLRVPLSCLQSRQPFYLGVGKRARHKVAKALRARLKVVKVSFSLDGQKLKTLKKKPFRLLVDPGPLAAGTKHSVSARVTALVSRHGRTKRVVRTLVGQVTIC